MKRLLLTIFLKYFTQKDHFNMMSEIYAYSSLPFVPFYVTRYFLLTEEYDFNLIIAEVLN